MPTIKNPTYADLFCPECDALYTNAQDWAVCPNGHGRLQPKRFVKLAMPVHKAYLGRRLREISPTMARTAPRRWRIEGLSDLFAGIAYRRVSRYLPRETKLVGLQFVGKTKTWGGAMVAACFRTRGSSNA